MVGLSLVVLTGWAGQISLGQFAFVGVGSVTAAKLFIDYGWDFWLTLIAAAVAGAIVAALVGLPALRVQGLLLAVASLALAAAAQGYLFVNKNDKYKIGQIILPSRRDRLRRTTGALGTHRLPTPRGRQRLLLRRPRLLLLLRRHAHA